MSEWHSANERSFLSLMFWSVVLIAAFVGISAFFSGCARPVWPEIGGGVRVEKIVIRECRKGECV